MTNRIFATLSSLALLTAAAAFAQTNATLQADIPFTFRVGTTTLPPGHYTVQPHVAAGVVAIRCSECKSGVMIQTIGVDTGKIQRKATLVFNRYHDTYFLSRVWTPGYSQGRELRQSRAEREMALNGSQPETAVVVGRR